MNRSSSIRVLHHWACSGGTILSRCIAAAPEVVLLSEMHPLAYLRQAEPSSHFAPTDLIQQLCLPHNDPDPVLCMAAWNGAIDALHEQLQLQDKVLVIRSHSHIDFFTGVLPAEQSLVSRSLAGRHTLKEALSVRHPLDSWISMRSQRWDQHFRFSSFDGFCDRALAMVHACSGMPVIRYEAFCSDPASGMAELTAALALDNHPTLLEKLDSVRLSGDSGRSHDRIAPRLRRPLAEADRVAVEDALHQADSSYRQLCGQLGYDPNPEAPHPFTLAR